MSLQSVKICKLYALTLPLLVLLSHSAIAAKTLQLTSDIPDSEEQVFHTCDQHKLIRTCLKNTGKHVTLPKSLSYRCGDNFKQQASVLNSQKLYDQNKHHSRQESTYTCKNTLADIVLHAFVYHQPLTLTPDVIWMTLVEGLVLHINNDPESFRHLYVDHKEKKELRVVASSWQSMTDEFVATLSQNIKEPDLINTIVKPFSTTTPEDTVAFSLAAMSSVKGYFDYFCSRCGIPSITLEGTTEDWEDLKTRIEYFRLYALDEWVLALHPVIDQFIKTSKGENNITFWRGMVKYFPENGFSGSVSRMNGWLVNLYPLVHSHQKLIPNSDFILGELGNADTYTDEKQIDTKSLPYSASTTNILIDNTNFLMVSGVLGYSYQNKSLKPYVSWLALPVGTEKTKTILPPYPHPSHTPEFSQSHHLQETKKVSDEMPSIKVNPMQTTTSELVLHRRGKLNYFPYHVSTTTNIEVEAFVASPANLIPQAPPVPALRLPLSHPNFKPPYNSRAPSSNTINKNISVTAHNLLADQPSAPPQPSGSKGLYEKRATLPVKYEQLHISTPQETAPPFPTRPQQKNCTLM